MPIYSHACDCGHEFESIRKFNECGIDQPCPKCGRMAKQVIAPSGYDPWKPFDSEVLGGSFPTRESYRAYCKKHNMHQLTTYEIREEKTRAKQAKLDLAKRRERERAEAHE